MRKNNQHFGNAFLAIGAILFTVCFVFTACTKSPSWYPNEVKIAYLGVSTDQVVLTDSASDGIVINLKFNDGDGDIGTDNTSTKEYVFIKDSRDTSTSRDYTFTFPIPYISPDYRPEQGGLEGFINVRMGKEYFSIIDPDRILAGRDTVRYFIYVKDDAGNKSPTVVTDPIYISL